MYININAAARDAARARNIRRARKSFTRANEAPNAQLVSICPGEWRAADALDRLAEDEDLLTGD